MGDEPTSVKPPSPEEALFTEALQCATPQDCAAYLQAACGLDAASRHRAGRQIFGRPPDRSARRRAARGRTWRRKPRRPVL